MLIPVRLIQWFWTAATHTIGMRHMGNALKRSLSAYEDTVFFWEEIVEGYVALTIDDGLCRNENNDSSMVNEVRDLLRSYNAHATFFVCSDYTTSAEEVNSLLNDNHELGNHLEKDIIGYYNNLGKEEFRRVLQETNTHLLKKTSSKQKQEADPPKKWFRAPNGRMTKLMRDVLREEGMVHVLGDCYCDDWAFAEADNVDCVAPLMLKQVHPGSIAVFHMPERGFREASLEAIKEFLRGVKEKNLQCITLTEMERISRNAINNAE
mmetsp:Transcript_26046/g.39425  ORF Transcript_26046/g.39425 Transcript_26046/m.39425 type:complete len:265 (-) Transcript_26046:102-896(-)|eukprot:CAMPEP_0178914186 /NCGR_PEP_ID=MMETSP0786-20121207/11281_1 /TAXON_ID=186022 /ORGANISM="Thalassionema frauenfeldii, Strain CCMP 1798" /LENGTH=264 /DNA_ID=CAMNT_0020587057 /DNA_START=46 /DNA_END=840 /DNA_ORIENTATION=-